MSDCKHYWILESPSGPTTKGECKHCDETKEFPNVNDTDIDDGMSKLWKSRGKELRCLKNIQ